MSTRENIRLIARTPFIIHLALSAIHYNCRLLSHLLMYFIASIANNMNPDQTAP